MDETTISVLIVSDVADSIDEVVQMLAGETDIVVVGSTMIADQALDLVKAHLPDLVVMDYDMPGLDGAEVTRQITRDSGGTMVIMLSVVNDANDIRHAMRAGARDYLIKPLEEGELLTTIRWLLGERREYARMQAFVSQLRKAYEALFTDDKPVPPKVVAYLEAQRRENPSDRLIMETLAVAYARNRNWTKLVPLASYLADTQLEGESG